VLIRRWVLSIASIWVAAMVLSVAGTRGQTVASPASSANPRLQAELLKTIDAAHARVGSDVTARTVTPLEFNGAKFPAGTIVKGHIAKAEPSRLVLVFDHIEAKKSPLMPMGLSLRAIMMPYPLSSGQSSSDSGQQRSPRAESLGGSRANPAVDSASSGNLMRSPAAAAADSVYMPSTGPRPEGPTVETRNGGVIGLPDVRLEVNSDPKVGAVFQVEQGHKLRLEKGLQLMFVVSAP
jgi:hypothetical protein